MKAIKRKDTIYYIIYNPNIDHYIHGLLSAGKELGTGSDNQILIYKDKYDFFNKYEYITGVDISKNY